MKKPFFEERSEEQKTARAIVIDWTLARVILWLCGGALTFAVIVGWQVRGTISDFDGRVKAIEDRRPLREAQIAELQSADREAARRLTALEIAITGLGALREQVDRGFSDIAKRLDRMEDDKP